MMFCDASLLIWHMVGSQNHICNPPILDMDLMLFNCFLACQVVSEVSHEGVAHRFVEMLPLVCPRDQRKAAQLQVSEHTTGVMRENTAVSFISRPRSCLQREDGPGI